MFPIILFKLAKALFWLIKSTFKFARQLINIQSLILVPLVLVMLMLPTVFDRRAPSEEENSSHLSSQQSNTSQNQEILTNSPDQYDNGYFKSTGFYSPPEYHK